jgi:hypothetical protein
MENWVSWQSTPSIGTSTCNVVACLLHRITTVKKFSELFYSQLLRLHMISVKWLKPKILMICRNIDVVFSLTSISCNCWYSGFQPLPLFDIIEKFCEFSNIFYSIIICKLAFGWDGIGLGLPQVQTSVVPSVTASIPATCPIYLIYWNIHYCYLYNYCWLTVKF